MTKPKPKIITRPFTPSDWLTEAALPAKKLAERKHKLSVSSDSSSGSDVSESWVKLVEDMEYNNKKGRNNANTTIK